MKMLVDAGIDPYYLFQCRPVKGAKNIFQVPILKGAALVAKVREELDGISGSFRYVLSHESGKVEILGILERDQVVFRYCHNNRCSFKDPMFIQKLSSHDCWLY